MIDPYDVPDRIPANDEPPSDDGTPEVDEDYYYEEYRQANMEEGE